MIVVQVALSLILLLGAGLFIRTLRNLQRVNVGFNQENLLLFNLAPQQNGYKDERLRQFYENLNARLDALPGVRAATFATSPLLAYNMWHTNVLLPGETASAEHLSNLQKVRENYFAALKISLLRGRGYMAQDDARAPFVGIVNQTFARQYFPDKEVLGQRVTDTNSKYDLRETQWQGRRTLLVAFRPHPGFLPPRKEVQWLTQLVGALWIDAAAKVVVKLQARLPEAALDSGVIFEQEFTRAPDGVWLSRARRINCALRPELCGGLRREWRQEHGQHQKFTAQSANEKLETPAIKQRGVNQPYRHTALRFWESRFPQANKFLG